MLCTNRRGKAWPSNGAHYGVALVQADGLYDLEMNANLGDSTDMFQFGNGLQPSHRVAQGPFPNTGSYQGGNYSCN